MTMPQARIGDMCLCALHPPPPPAGPIAAPTALAFVGAPTVLVGNMPAARISDNHIGLGPHPIIKGSATVIISNMPAARVTDNTACGGMVLPPCCPTVLTGG